MKPDHTKWIVLAMALLLFMGDLGGLIGKYQNWEFHNSTEFVAAILMSISKTGITAISGNLFKSIAGEGA